MGPNVTRSTRIATSLCGTSQICCWEKYQTTCNRKNYRTNSDYNQEYTGDSSRDLCLCSGGGKQLCANRQELLDSYNDGNTEYQNFAAKQKDIGGPFWHSTNFDNY